MVKTFIPITTGSDSVDLNFGETLTISNNSITGANSINVTSLTASTGNIGNFTFDQQCICPVVTESSSVGSTGARFTQGYFNTSVITPSISSSSPSLNINTSEGNQIIFSSNSIQIQGTVGISLTGVNLGPRGLVVNDITQDTDRDAYAQIRFYNPTGPAGPYTVSHPSTFQSFTGPCTSTVLHTNVLNANNDTIQIRDENVYKISLNASLTSSNIGPYSVSVIRNGTDTIGVVNLDKMGEENVSDTFIRSLTTADTLAIGVGTLSNSGVTTDVSFRTVTLLVEKVRQSTGGLQGEALVTAPTVPTFALANSPTLFPLGSDIIVEVFQSTSYLTFTASKLFDNLYSGSNFWHTEPFNDNLAYDNQGVYNTSGTSTRTIDGVERKGEWFSIDMGRIYRLDSYTLHPRNNADFFGEGHPREWILASSVDGTTWTQIDSQSLGFYNGHASLQNPNGTTTQPASWLSAVTFNLAQPVETRYLLMSISKVYPNIPRGTNYVCFQEFTMALNN